MRPFHSAREFLAQTHHAITLMGMSGIGKSTLARRLSRDTWFHYSVDYRIGTRYLSEPILDNVKLHAMRDPFLAGLLRSDSIYIGSNITIDNLEPISSFLGMIGNTARGGLSLEAFRQRQHLHYQAEVAAMCDVDAFIEKARSLYGYDHFLCDASGSLCELDEPDLFETLAQRTVLLHIRTSEAQQQLICRRAADHPKPLYYAEAFFNQVLARYLQEQHLCSAEAIEPLHFVRWVFPHLLQHRLPRYEHIAACHGYSVTYSEIDAVRDDRDLLDLICVAIERTAS